MAASETIIANRALQKLGADRINDLNENSPNARRMSTAFASVRDAELRKHYWRFAIKRVVLAPSSTTPAFDFLYSFPLPADCVRIIKPVDRYLDWQVEGGAILTNDSDQLELRYVSRVTNTTLFDPLFDEALASRLAYELCEAVTQSSTKKEFAAADYKTAIAEARKANAFETIPQDQPEDEWLTARY